MLLFLRHGMSQANICPRALSPDADPPLTSSGRAQIQDVARYLSNWLQRNNKILSRIAVSPLLRTMETAGLLVECVRYDSAILLDPLLREHHEGSPAAEGMPKQELLTFLENERNPLAGLQIDKALIMKEIWFNKAIESSEDFQMRIAEIQETYVIPSDATQDITLIISHAAVGHALRADRKEPANGSLFVLRADGQSESLCIPQQYNPITNFPYETPFSSEKTFQDLVSRGLDIRPEIS